MALSNLSLGALYGAWNGTARSGAVSSSLNAATANKLLKVLEEPPAGYKFILLAENLNSIPITIVSRSHIIKTTDNNEQDTSKHALFKYFTKPENLPDPMAFDQHPIGYHAGLI